MTGLDQIQGLVIGHHPFDDGAGINYAYAGRRLEERELQAVLDFEFPERDGWPCHTHDGDCCGRTFGRPARIRVSRGHTLITQRVGRDL